MEVELAEACGSRILDQTGELTKIVRQGSEENELHVVKRYEFSSEAQCMSVVAV
jgi:hypothetical protein